MAAFGTMPTQHFRILLLLVTFSVVTAVVSEISDLRKCGDKTCSVTLSRATVLARYPASSPLHLTLNRGDIVEIKSKSAGSRPELWGGEIKGRKGYFPRAFVKEFSVKIENPVFEVPTEANIWKRQPPPPGQQQQPQAPPQREQQPPQQQQQEQKQQQEKQPPQQQEKQQEQEQQLSVQKPEESANDVIQDDIEIDETDLTDMDDTDIADVDQIPQVDLEVEKPQSTQDSEATGIQTDGEKEEEKEDPNDKEAAHEREEAEEDEGKAFQFEDVEALQKSLMREEDPVDPQEQIPHFYQIWWGLEQQFSCNFADKQTNRQNNNLLGRDNKFDGPDIRFSEGEAIRSKIIQGHGEKLKVACEIVAPEAILLDPEFVLD